MHKNFSAPVLRLYVLLTIWIVIGTSATVFAAPKTMRGLQVSHVATAEDIAVLKSWRVNVIRYPIVWVNQDLDSSTEESWNAWFQQSLLTLDQQLALYNNAGIKVIVNLYSPPGGFSRRDSKATHRIFQQAWAQRTFIAAWKTLAEKYGKDKRVVAFDLLNEPAEASRPRAPLKDWNSLAFTVAKAVRTRSSKPIIMSPVYGKTTRISKMKKIPLKDIIYTIHFYEPFRFIHQGVYSYPLNVRYPDKKWNYKALEKQLRPIISYQKRNKVRVYIGEFSVARWAPNGSGARYLSDVIKIFEKYKWDWTYHAFREASIWNLELSDKYGDEMVPATPTARLKTVRSFLKRNKRL